MYKRAKNSWMKHWDFILVDFLCIQLSFILAYGIRHYNMFDRFVLVYEKNGYNMLCITLAVLHLCLVLFMSSYSGVLRRGHLDEFGKVLVHNASLMAGLFAYLVLIRISEQVSRITLVLFMLFNICFMYLARIIVKKIVLKVKKAKVDTRKALIITTPSQVREVVNKFKDIEYVVSISGISLISGSAESVKEIEGIPVVARNIDDTCEFACRNVVDEVFVYIPQTDDNLTGEIANMFLRMGITVHINLDMLTSGMPNVEVEKYGSYTVMTSSINVMTPLGAVIKRLIDIAAGIVGCIIAGIIFIFLAPAIKIADPGPIFFGQNRAGKNGRVFKIYKFRSMYMDAEERKKELMKDNKMDGLMFKMDADPRIIGSGPDGTRKGLGYWIRTLSLDEFPNFYSILKGDMSLVGTRPPTMDEYERYSPHHKSRLAFRPGLTGMWQVSGRSDMTNFEEIVALDTEYIKNWSIALDIKIIFKTFIVVMKRKGSM